MTDHRRAYLREYQRNWVKKRRVSWLAENGPCAQCGGTKDLEVDHIDPLSKITHAVWSWSAERRLKELSKCQVLCRECHREKTKIDNSNIFTGSSVYSTRKFSRKDYLRVLYDYFALKISRRKVATKYGLSQGTISSWIYRSNCSDWFQEFKILFRDGREGRHFPVKEDKAGALPAPGATFSNSWGEDPSPGLRRAGPG